MKFELGQGVSRLGGEVLKGMGDRDVSLQEISVSFVTFSVSG